jgi:zinc protease
MLAASVYAQDSMGSLARIFGNGLMQGQTFEEIRTWTDRIARVTPEQVNAAARQWLDMRRSVTGTLARGDAQRPRS